MAHTGRCKIFPTHSSTNRASVIGLAAGTFNQCRLCGADGRRLRVAAGGAESGKYPRGSCHLAKLQKHQRVTGPQLLYCKS